MCTRKQILDIHGSECIFLEGSASFRSGMNRECGFQIRLRKCIDISIFNKYWEGQHEYSPSSYMFAYVIPCCENASLSPWGRATTHTWELVMK